MQSESPVERVIAELGITDHEWYDVLGFSESDKRGFVVPIYLQCLLEESGKADLSRQLNKAQNTWREQQRNVAEAKIDALTPEILRRVLETD